MYICTYMGNMYIYNNIYYIVGVVPIIRCPRGNAAEVVAKALDKKIRENLRDARNSMFSGENIPIAQLRYSA